MNENVFYNKQGKPIAYISDKDNETIYLFNGSAVAYIYNESIYSFKGKHLGFFENGWIYDNNGYCVYFTPNATGGPFKPAKTFVPAKSFQRVKPFKHAKSFRPAKPMKRLSWCDDSDRFFD